VSEVPAGDSKPAPHRRSWSDPGPRVASAAVLVPLAAISVILGGYLFAAVIGIVFAGAYREWETMVTLKPITPIGIALLVAVALSALAYPLLGIGGTAAIIAVAAVAGLFTGREAGPWRAGGLIFLGVVIAAIMLVRSDTFDGIVACFYVGIVIWITDTAAFFTGRQVGGEKLAPGISPGKTWSGAIGGLAIATLQGLIVWLTMTQSPWWIGLILSAGLSVLGQVGDLSESALKRRFRVKDSGDIIPGHGGLMDRLDSITFGAIAALIVGAVHAGPWAVATGLLRW
jgi:phosphatidate cytidylyltransferase